MLKKTLSKPRGSNITEVAGFDVGAALVPSDQAGGPWSKAAWVRAPTLILGRHVTLGHLTFSVTQFYHPQNGISSYLLNAAVRSK